MKAFQFKITLTYTDDPVVWRRLVVPEDISFDEFHLAIQSVFGWDFSHLYQFSAKGWGSKPYYQLPGDWAEDDDDMRDSEEYLISEVFKRAGKSIPTFTISAMIGSTRFCWKKPPGSRCLPRIALAARVPARPKTAVG
jgi:hypothetical protein